MKAFETVRPYLSIAWKFGLLLAILSAASYAGDLVMSRLTPHLTPSTDLALHRVIMAAISIYVVLMMLPFVFEIEIGLGMIVMFGPKIVLLVYGATVLALILGFLSLSCADVKALRRASITVGRRSSWRRTSGWRRCRPRAIPLEAVDALVPWESFRAEI